MKKLIFVLFFAAFSAFSMQAQIKTPAASPAASLTQTVGLTDVSIEYSRPSMKGRTIFSADGLVPHGKLWRTGANGATKLTVSNDVTVSGNELEKGSYAVLTTPGASSWEIHFHKYEGRSWGSYADKTAALTITAPAKKSGMKVESFLIMMDVLTSKSGMVKILWDETVVAFDIGADSDAAVMSTIDKVLSGPSKGDYYAAASYYYSAGKDLNKALEYVTKATDGPDKKFWQMKMKSEILGKLGKYKEAIAAAKTSLELATAAGNNDYIKMNNDNIAKWMK